MQKKIDVKLCAVTAALIVFMAFLLVLDSPKAAAEQPAAQSVAAQTQNAASKAAEGQKASDKERLTLTSENTAQPAVFADLRQARLKAPDAAAWLSVSGAGIDAPVMQSDDNSYYLRRNEKGADDAWGCYFADYYSRLEDKESLRQNTVIYGHTDKSEDPDGKRFNRLFRFLDADFQRANPNISLTVGDETLTFEIFAVFFTGTSFYYIDPQPSNGDFDDFCQQISRNNLHFSGGAAVSPDDKLLTLSGCAFRYDTANTGSHRFVVMGKLVE